MKFTHLSRENLVKALPAIVGTVLATTLAVSLTYFHAIFALTGFGAGFLAAIASGTALGITTSSLGKWIQLLPAFSWILPVGAAISAIGGIFTTPFAVLAVALIAYPIWVVVAMPASLERLAIEAMDDATLADLIDDEDLV